MTAFVSKRLNPVPSLDAANVAQPVDGPTVTTPTVNRATTLQGFRGRPVSLLWSLAPDYLIGAGTKAYTAHGALNGPQYVNDLSDATFDFSDPIRLRFRSTPWAKYVWLGIQVEAQSYTANSNKKPVIHAYMQTPVVNGAGGFIFDNGCLMEPAGDGRVSEWGGGILQFASTGIVPHDTTVKSGVPRLLNLAPGGATTGVDTDVEVVIDLASVASPTGVRVFSVSAWELWEATVS